MTNPVRLVRDHPLVAFTVLACLFGWSSWIAAAFGLGSHPGNNPLGPGVAALAVVACQGRAELATWWRRLRTWGAAPGWYALAFLAPLAVHVVIVLVNHAFGAPLPTAPQLAHWTELPVVFAVLLVVIGIGEESAWTAFAAPLLLQRHGFVGVWAVLSAVRILWHLPLLISGDLPLVTGVVGNAAFQLVVLAVFQASSGRWSLAAVWHASLNTFGASFLFTMVTGADQARLGWLLSAAYALLAVVALALVRRRGTPPEAGSMGRAAEPAVLVPARL